MARSGVAHRPLQGLVPGAEHHQLSAPVHDAFRHCQDQVQPLLVGHARDDPEQGRLGFLGEAHFFLQLLLATLFACQGADGVVIRQVPVGCRVPFRRIDTVQHAVQVGMAGSQQAL